MSPGSTRNALNERTSKQPAAAAAAAPARPGLSKISGNGPMLEAVVAKKQVDPTTLRHLVQERHAIHGVARHLAENNVMPAEFAAKLQQEANQVFIRARPKKKKKKPEGTANPL